MASVITSLITTTVTAKPTASSASSRAVGQGGIIEGANPSRYDPKNPLILFIIQAGIIIIFCRILHFPLSKLKQPRVIAEIIGGILLGPSVMGRIPGFTNHIFPAASMPTLTLAANLGLVFFLFLVGLEVDLRLLSSNWRIALSVGAGGMALPFGLGCAIAYGLYHQFRNDPSIEPISFGTYVLFVGVAMAITAFPVLCRILTELKLLQTQVGVVVLSAGVGNDVVGWILLALCVALVNAGSGISALWVLLTCFGYVLVLTFAIRPVFVWVLKRSGSLQHGPTQTMVAMTILMMLASSFFTGIIGVHPIFGAFLVGLICPHDGGFAIKLTEKIEDLICAFFLPLYFALSGLSTNIGLLDSGITWAYVIGVIAVAFFGKVIGGTLAARFCGLIWRESFTIGALMSCKGLVELIVLNIGFQAKILSQRTFTIFVVMALITTFATTPLVSALFPPWYQRKLGAWKRGEIDWDGNRLAPESDSSEQGDAPLVKHDGSDIRKLLVYLRLESLPSLFTFVALLGGEQSAPAKKVHPRKASITNEASPDHATIHKRPLEAHGLRFLELSERQSSVMKDSEIEDFSIRDPVINAFHTFGQLHNVAVSGQLEFVPEGSYAKILAGAASDYASDIVLLPWSETGKLVERTTSPDAASTTFTNGPHNQFIADFLSSVSCNAAIFIDNGFGALPRKETKTLTRVITTVSLRSLGGSATSPISDRSHHIFFPFFGGADDRVALQFVLRLAQNPSVTATILHITGADPIGEVSLVSSPLEAKNETDVHSSPVLEKSQSRSDDVEQAFFHTMKDSLPHAMESRVVFDTIESHNSLSDAIIHARAEVGRSPRNAGDVIVVGRSRGSGVNFSLPSSPHHAHSEAAQCLGKTAEAMIKAELKASVLVLYAGKKDKSFG